MEKTLGAKEAIIFDRVINREVRMYKRNLYVGWTDVRKAYDSVFQEFIIEMLNFIKAPKWIIGWLKEAMRTWRTILQVKEGKQFKLSREIEIDCGIFQGDSLSPTLFCIAFMIVSFIVRNLKLGYVPGPPSNRETKKMKTHGLLMDDLKIYTSGKTQLEKVMKEVTVVMKSIGLSLGMDKCAILAVERGKVKPAEDIVLSEDQIIEALEDNKLYTYLGMAQREDCVDSLIKETVKKEFIQRTKTVWKSLLSAKNKVRAYNSVCVGLLTYCFGLIKWTKSELESLDKDVRKVMTMNKGFSKHSDVDRLFLQRKNGGRGLVCIKDFYDRMCVSTVGYIMKATTVQGKTIKDHYMHKGEGTLLQTSENIISELSLNIEFKEDQILIDGRDASGKLAVERIKKAQHRSHLEKWGKKSVHGAVYRNLKAQNVNWKESFGWMEGKGLTATTESKVFAVQEQEIAVKVTRREVWKEDIEEVNCRSCKTDRESVDHILCGCKVLLKSEYFIRHDGMMRVIYSNLLVKYGFETELKSWYRDEYVESVKENDCCKLFWNFEFQTNRFVKHNKPDIVVIEKQSKELIIIEGSTPGDMNLEERSENKKTKYSQLGTDLFRQNELKSLKLISLIIGTTGVILDSAVNNFKLLFKEESTRILRLSQKAVIMGTFDIFKLIYKL